jgi:hypothetical protein
MMAAASVASAPARMASAVIVAPAPAVVVTAVVKTPATPNHNDSSPVEKWRVVIPVRISAPTPTPPAVDRPVWFGIDRDVAISGIGRSDIRGSARVILHSGLPIPPRGPVLETGDAGDVPDHPIADSGAVKPNEVIGGHIRLEPRLAGPDEREDGGLGQLSTAHLNDIVEERVRKPNLLSGLTQSVHRGEKQDTRKDEVTFHGIHGNKTRPLLYSGNAQEACGSLAGSVAGLCHPRLAFHPDPPVFPALYRQSVARS